MKRTYQSGIALIQVLLLTAILTVLALYITATAKSQVEQAQWINDKSIAQVEMHSAESLLLFELLTQKKKRIQESNDFDSQNRIDIKAEWNFFAEPFNINQYVTASIQDESGRLQLHYPQTKRVEKALTYLQISSDEATRIMDSLLDWQDIDSIQRINGAEYGDYGGEEHIRNGAIPSIYDIKFAANVTPAVVEFFEKNATIYKKGPFSPMNAPIELLEVLTSKTVAEQVSMLRINNQLTADVFSDLTGIIETDNVFFYTSSYMLIKLTSKVGTAEVSKSFNVHIQPYAENKQTPINIYVVRG